jgi:drug/metabolite transporter (DMT)-like permease
MVVTQRRIGRREVTGAFLTLVGIMFFLSAGQPSGGSGDATAAKWWTACLVTLALVIVLSTVGSRFSGAGKALTLGSAAGLGLGLQAAVTKTFVDQLGGGFWALLTTWSTYVLVASAVIGFVLLQSALRTGVLAPAMASSNSVTLFSSVILGIIVYGEKLSGPGGAHTSSTFLGLAVAVVGISLLAGAQAPAGDQDVAGTDGASMTG